MPSGRLPSLDYIDGGGAMSIFGTGLWFGLGFRDTEIDPARNLGYSRVRALGVNQTVSFTHSSQGGSDLWEPFDRLMVFDEPTGGNLLWDVEFKLSLQFGQEQARHGMRLYAGDTVNVLSTEMEDYSPAPETETFEDVPVAYRGFGV